MQTINNFNGIIAYPTVCMLRAWMTQSNPDDENGTTWNPGQTGQTSRTLNGSKFGQTSSQM
jgi:hypothetical protein